jgi:hypothetical protein
MPNYRRGTSPGATWFFTVNLRERKDNDLLVREIATLRRCFAKERTARPFTINAWVVLPEHMHLDLDVARWRRGFRYAMATDQDGVLQATTTLRMPGDDPKPHGRTRHLAAPLLGTSDP